MNYETIKIEKVDICLGGAFTKDTGQRNLVRRANKTVAIEGCFISCSSRMMKGVLPSLRPEIVQADMLYDSDLPFGIDEVSEEELRECARTVAETVVAEHIKNSESTDEKASRKESTCSSCKLLRAKALSVSGCLGFL